MPTKRSHSSQFQFRGDGNKHPSPRRASRASFSRQSSFSQKTSAHLQSSSDLQAQGQSTLRSSARINEIRARAAKEEKRSSGESSWVKDSSSSQQKKAYVSHKKPPVQRSFKPRTSVTAQTKPSRASRPAVVTNNANYLTIPL